MELFYLYGLSCFPFSYFKPYMPRSYTQRESVNWYDETTGPPQHNQKHRVTKKYYNQFKGIWCSKKSKKQPRPSNRVTVYSFTNCPIEDLKAKYYPEHERVAMFLTRLYNHQYTGYGHSDWDYQYIDQATLRSLLGYYWHTIVEDLVKSSLIDIRLSPSKNNAFRDCRYFRLSRGILDVQGTIYSTTSIQDPGYEKQVLKYYDRLSLKRTGILKHIELTLDSTSLAIDDLSGLHGKMWQNKLEQLRLQRDNEYATVTDRRKADIVLSNPEKHQKEYLTSLDRYYTYLNRILTNDLLPEKRALYNIRVTPFNSRISHLISNAPKEYRKLLKINGDPIVELDIKSSQPSFLFVLFSNWYDANNGLKKNIPASQGYMQRFQIANESGLDIYRYMALKLKGIKSVNDPFTRAEMKTLFYRLVFGKPFGKLGSYDKREVIINLFGLDLYEFLSGLAKSKLGIQKGATYKNLSALLQREESRFMNTYMSTLMTTSTPFLPIYDSIMTPETKRVVVVGTFDKIVSLDSPNSALSLKY